MKGILVSVYLFLSISVFSQDSLVYLKDVQFDSPFEKEVFDNYFKKGKTDIFDIFISNGHLLTEDKIKSEKDRFYQFVTELDLAKYDGKKTDKKIKAIYDGLHKKYFAKFSATSDFEELFVNGSYNSSTASALCAIIMEKENIPYIIKEDPGNIYVIAYPKAERIILKPDAGETVQSYDLVYKQAFITKLKDQKIISSREASSMDVNTLFDKYYFGSHQDLFLTNLVGIQYMNQALLELQSKDLKRAFQQMEKAYLYFPSERTSYLMFQIATEYLNAMESKTVEHAALLAKIARLGRYGITNDMVVSEFGMVIQRLLFEQSNAEKLTAYYHKLKEALKNPSLRIEIEYLYNYEVGRFYYNQGKYSEALPFFEQTIVVKETSQDALGAFIGTLIQIVNNDNLKIISDFNKYAKLYPILSQNNNFNSVLAAAYLIQFGREYDIGSPSQGAKYQIEFENMFEKIPNLQVDQGAIGNMYSIVAVYFYRKGQTSKAKAIIEKGLIYAPNNYELLARKRMIN